MQLRWRFRIFEISPSDRPLEYSLLGVALLQEKASGVWDSRSFFSSSASGVLVATPVALAGEEQK